MEKNAMDKVIKLKIPDRIDFWAGKNDRIKKLMASDYGKWLMEAYSDLDIGSLYVSFHHGIGHIERVILLGAMIAQAQHFSEHETKMLLLCCSYHDVGRVNDDVDDAHGPNSAVLMAKERLIVKFAPYSPADFAVMRAAVACHSLSDKRMQEIGAKFSIDDEHRERYFRIAKCLKDADNLDRVRFDDLDTKHLRHSESIKMESDAWWIVGEYNK